MKPVYCVTAKNRLTGQREEVRLKYGISRSSKRPYTHPKVELLPIPKQLELKFEGYADNSTI